MIYIWKSILYIYIYVYIYRVQNGIIGIKSTENSVLIFISTILLCWNVFILQFHPTVHLSFSEWVYYPYMYSAHNQVSGMNISNNCVRIVIFSVISCHGGSSSRFSQHSMLGYPKEEILYLSTGFAKKLAKWILLTVLLVYRFISYS